ncbi:MAG: NAD(+) synthase, partial [Atopobiaceae bacterium]|nr:NAD(+) synthase [Atopobiaceae bacterium]
MKDGFVPVAAVSPRIRVADVENNVAACEDAILTATEEGARVVVLPELTLTSSTAGDLFFQTSLLRAAEAGIASLCDTCRELDALVIVGAPMRVAAKLYDCAFAISAGRLLGIVPKVNVPAMGDGGTLRHFTPGTADCVPVSFAGFSDVPFGANQLFSCVDVPDLVVAVEVGEDLVAPFQPSQDHALAGATLIANPCASAEIVGRADKRLAAVVSQSARLTCAYIQVEAGSGESTTDMAFGGHKIICEMGNVLCEA